MIYNFSVLKLLRSLLKNLINITVLILGILSLFLDHLYQDKLMIFFIINIIDFSIVLLSLYELLKNVKLAKYKLIYIQRNIISLIFLAVFLLLFILNKTALLFGNINQVYRVYRYNYIQKYFYFP